MTWKNIGHFIASIAIGIFDAATGHPTDGSAAEAVGAGIGQIALANIPGGQPLVNASVTAFGDIVQAVKKDGQALKAGEAVTFVVSDALAQASQTVWPDVEKLLAAFAAAIGEKAAPAAAKAA